MSLFRSKPRLGIVLLGSWLIATGILHLVPRIGFSGSGEILAGLAIAAGVSCFWIASERPAASVVVSPLRPGDAISACAGPLSAPIGIASEYGCYVR